MKNWRRYLPAGMLAVIVAAAAMLTFTVRAEKPEDNTIPDRVYFGTISGGGLTKEEATQQIEAYVEQLSGTKVTLSAGENTFETTAEALGLSWRNPEIVEEAAGLGKSGNLVVRYKAMKDLEHEEKVYTIAYAVDTEKITQLLNDNMGKLEKKAVDAGLKRENGKFTVIPGSQGVTVNVEESVKAVEEYFTTRWKGETEVSLALTAEILEPRGSAEELAQVKDVLGTYHTDYSSSAAGRSTNLSVGAGKIDGTVLYPGDQFSMYEVCSPFNAENGYKLAGAYENGTTIESYGGGICQVSTTLYNAVIRAELEIVERYPHSMTVSYVDPSGDAAIAGTYKDMKFVNNTDAPIYIEGYTKGKVIYFTVYGHETRAANRKVSFVSETLESIEPETEFRTTSAPVGTVSRVQGAHKGVKARLWKIVTVDGQEVSKEVFNTSTYRASSAIYEVGTASSNANAVAAIKAALATKDLATIKAAAAAWSDEALAAQQPQEPATPDPGAAESGTTP